MANMPHWKEYEYALAEKYGGKRQPFSGASKHEKMDVEAGKFLIEAKTAPEKTPDRFIIKEAEFAEYRKLARHKGRLLIFAVEFANAYSMSFMNTKDAQLAGLSCNLQDWCGWKSVTNSAGSHTLKLSTYKACDEIIRKEGKDKWFIILTDWRETLIAMPTDTHIEELAKVGAL